MISAVGLFLVVICTVPAVLQGLPAQTIAPFHVDVQENGAYDVKVGGVSWLPSGPTFLNRDGKRYCTMEGTLKLVRFGSTTGEDKFGAWNKTTFTYTAAGQLAFKTSVKVYTKPTLPVAIFSQTYASNTAGTRGKDRDDIISSFPSFRFVPNTTADLAYLAYGDDMAGWQNLSLNRWSKNANFTTGIQGGPLVLFDKSNKALVISPLSNFMSASNKKFEDEHISWGIMGLVDKVPASYTTDFIISFSDRGVNQAMRDWGLYLTTTYNKTSAARDKDLTLSHLGYWTDNGAYYYYNTEKEKNYEETMVDATEYLRNEKLPVKYLQIDSWFYPKGHVKGTKTWVADKSIFPNDFLGLYQKTKLPIGCHNRYWDNDTTYAKYNGGKYNFIPDSSSGCAVPDDQQFWIDLFQSTQKWGKFILYEQDWLNKETDRNLALVSDLHLGRRWLLQMGKAAEQFGIAIQYCMSYSRHILQSLEIPAVTQARVSDDYQPGLKPKNNDQYKIGITAMFADALNLAPSKDTFWSTSEQPGNPYKGFEKAPYLQTLIATLSGGPVGPGDGIAFANSSLLKKCCDSDGKILRGSQSLTIMDKALIQEAFSSRAPTGRGEVLYSTFSDISGYIFGTIVADNVVGLYKLVPEDLTPDYPQMQDKLVTYVFNEYNVVFIAEWSHLKTLNVGTQCSENLCVYHSAPGFLTADGVRLGLLGEVGEKFAPVSPQRYSDLSLNQSEDELSVKVRLNGNEAVSVKFFVVRPSLLSVVTAECQNTSQEPRKALAYVNSASGHGCVIL